MNHTRVIPVLSIKNGGLVKSLKFKDHKYIGDPINAVKILNEKEVDELIVVDIDASAKRKSPNIEMLSSIADEAFMPLSYGGGISTLNGAKEILNAGAEKVILNTATLKNKKLIKEIADFAGSSSVVVSVDIKSDFLHRYSAYILNGSKRIKTKFLQHCQDMEDLGAGEIFLNDINRDGTYKGFDLELIKVISSKINIPLIACGGASNISDFKLAVEHGASAVAAGSLFVFSRQRDGILINYPDSDVLSKLFDN